MRPLIVLIVSCLCLTIRAELIISEFLAGYHLTDDAELLTKWTFPDVSIPANGYLIVFASSKDRATTPGSANSVSAAGRVMDTEFSVDRGIFSASFSPAITSATENVEIRYTQDGSTPTATHGFIYATAIST